MATIINYSNYKSPANLLTGAWHPGDESGQYIEADLITPRQLYGITTQGSPHGEQWMTSYSISYSLNGSVWIDIADSFTGNSDQNTKVTNALAPATGDGVTARYIRLYTGESYAHPTMRWDVIGCPACVASYMVCDGTQEPVVSLTASSVFDSRSEPQYSCLDRPHVEDGHFGE